MQVLVKKTDYLQGVITPPGSKSQAIRALIFALLASGESTVNHLPSCEDVTDALHVLQSMGVKLTLTSTGLKMDGRGICACEVNSPLYTGNSGITTRFILPILGLRSSSSVPVLLDCGDQMKSRPIASLFQALRNLGMQIECLEQQDQFPVKITGKLIGGKTSVSGMTSQFISALLIALPLASNESEIIVENLNERPYVEMTLAWLRHLGIKVMHHQTGAQDIFVIPAQQQYRPFTYSVPADFSNASYLIGAGVMLPGEISIENVDFSDTQGDKELINILRGMGAQIECQGERITIIGGIPLKGIEIDANSIPDLVPTLAVIGTFASGETALLNVPQARLKETDRLHSMTTGLRQLGASVIEKEDGLIIKQSRLKGGTVDSFNDHRTAMALSIAGLIAENETRILGAQAMHKTYPHFIEDISRLGAKIGIHHE